MSDGKVFTEETKELLIKTAVEGIKVPFWAKPFLKPALRATLSFIEPKADKVVPDKIDPLINNAITATIEGDYDRASNQAAVALNMVVDIPLVGEVTEHQMFQDAVRLIIRVIQNWIEKKKRNQL